MTIELNKRYILDKPSIALKLERMALEIAERNIDADHIVLAGIEPAGPLMNTILKRYLKEFFAGKVDCISIKVDDKKQPGKVVVEPMPDLSSTVLVVTDDVSNSGKTQTYILKAFLENLPASIQMLVLVNRSHKKYPVQPDYVGFSLATTIEEYIDVEIEDGQITGAWMK